VRRSGKTAEKTRYNRKAYTSHIFRVRNDVELAERLAVFKSEGNSLNYLINCLLYAYFNIEGSPVRYRYERTVVQSYYPKMTYKGMVLDTQIVNPASLYSKEEEL